MIKMVSKKTYNHIAKGYLLAAVLMFCSFFVYAQVDTAFWFAMPRLTHEHAGRPVKLCVSTFDEAADVTVTMPAATNPNITTFHVDANSFHEYQLVGGGQSGNQNILANIADYECDHNAISNKGVYIHSTAKIIAYISVMCNNSEIYALKGNNGLGKKFFIPMQYSYDVGNYQEARNSVEVIATEDNTVVQITPSKNLYGGQQANQTFTKNLNRGQVFSFASASRNANQHLEGSIVTANKPIVVDVSDDSATPNNANQDLVADQIVPEEIAGKLYIVIPSPQEANNSYNNSKSDHAYIFALENNTNVTVYKSSNSTGAPWTTTEYNNLNRGDKKDYHFTDYNAIFIEADKPILVFQVLGAGNELGGTLLPHVECTGSKAVTYRPMASYHGHDKSIYLTLICPPQTDKDQFQITANNQTVSINQNDWKGIMGNIYYYCCKKINNTSGTIKVTNPSGKFHMGVIDWNGSYDDCSISYFSDYNPDNHLTWDTTRTHFDYCQGDTIHFAFDSLDMANVRVIGPDGFVIEPGEPFYRLNAQPSFSGNYVVWGQPNICMYPEQRTDTITITVHPITDSTIKDTVCYGEPYTKHGFNISSDTTKIIAIHYDTLNVPGGNVHGCDSLLYLQLFVKDSIRTSFSDTSCIEYVWNGVTYASSGSYKQALQSVDGCDSVVTLNLYITNPTAAIVAREDFCYYGETTLSAESDFTNYVWNTGETTKDIFVNNPGTYSVTVTNDNGTCQISTSYLIQACDFNFYLPNSITPYTMGGNDGNSSNGHNDYFEIPEPYRRFIKDFDIEIYNRWGTLVFHSNDINFKWSGEGEKENLGKQPQVYIYIIRYTNLDGKPLVKKGDLVVIF